MMLQALRTISAPPEAAATLIGPTAAHSTSAAHVPPRPLPTSLPQALAVPPARWANSKTTRAPANVAINSNKIAITVLAQVQGLLVARATVVAPRVNLWRHA